MTAKKFEKARERIQEFFRTDPAGGLVLSLLKPEPPFDRGSMVSAFVAASSMVCVAVLSGMALAALAVLLVALFLLSVILTRVMGIDLGFSPEFTGF